MSLAYLVGIQEQVIRAINFSECSPCKRCDCNRSGSRHQNCGGQPRFQTLDCTDRSVVKTSNDGAGEDAPRANGFDDGALEKPGILPVEIITDHGRMKRDTL